MKVFKDWAGQEIIYDFKYEPVNEDSNENTFYCYIKPNNPDEDGLPMGNGKTKEIALKDAIENWNYYDTIGRG
jgi:hypothetical protein